MNLLRNICRKGEPIYYIAPRVSKQPLACRSAKFYKLTAHTASDPSVLIFWVLKFLYFHNPKHPKSTVPEYFCSGGLYFLTILVFPEQSDIENSQTALNYFIKQHFWHTVFTYTTSDYIIETYVQSLTILRGTFW